MTIFRVLSLATLIAVACWICISPTTADAIDALSSGGPTENTTTQPGNAPPPQSPVTSALSPEITAINIETEVAAFLLTGQSAREKYSILDLDIALGPDGRRYFPLLRLLQGLQLEWEKEDGRITFQPEGGSTVTIDLTEKHIYINGIDKPAELLVAVSDITMQEDIFLLPEVISEIFAFTLEWDDETYSFQATTERLLSIWKRPEWVSLLGIKTEEILQSLPEAHPQATTDSRLLSLDFMEVEGRATYRPVDPNDSETFTVDSLGQTLYGGLLSGRYKLELVEPDFSYDDGSFDTSDDPALMAKWFEWRKYHDDNILAVVGDSRFGLSDLSFPSVLVSGIRINGLVGVDENTRDKDASRLGLGDSFTGSQVYEGFAPVDSQVELLINDRLIETDTVRSSTPSLPGTGIYRFDNIILAPGSLNEVRIVITDPDGTETIIEKNVLESSSFLTPGGLTFLTSVGTNRDTDEWQAQGLFSGGRLFYGLSPRLTLSAGLAYQDNFFEPITLTDDPDDRQYPTSSLHANGQLAWKPSDNSIVLGNLAWVTSEDDETAITSDDFSFKIDSFYTPLEKMDFRGLYLWYGPDFFDGNSRNLYDRQGFVLNGHYFPNRTWQLDLAGSRIWDNLDGERDETLSVNLGNIKMSTSLLPRSTWTAAFHRVAPDWDEDPHNLYSLGVRSSYLKGYEFTGYYATGDDLDLDQNDDFLDGLRLPGISRFESEKITATLRKRLSWGGSIALKYLDSNSNERLSVIHTDTMSWRYPIDIRTEVGYDLDEQTYFFENRTETALSENSRSRLGLLVRAEDEEWKVEFYMNISELFTFLGGKPSHVSRRQINPEGKVVSGRVFIDSNANTVLDPGEPGIEEITVIFNNRRKSITNDRGSFFLSTSGAGSNGLVNIDPDSVPAIFSCTHGKQGVKVMEGEVTIVNFGLTPVHYVSGKVIVTTVENETFPLAGVRVYVTTENDDIAIAQSITADDGSYYLQDIRPGKYVIRVNRESVPEKYTVLPGGQTFEIVPSIDPQEVTPEDIVAVPAKNMQPENNIKILPEPIILPQPTMQPATQSKDISRKDNRINDLKDNKTNRSVEVASCLLALLEIHSMQ